MSKRKPNEDLILAQWQTCVEMANSVSQRRDTMNNVFITLNLALLAAVSLVWDIKSVFIIIVGIIGFIVLFSTLYTTRRIVFEPMSITQYIFSS